MGPAEFKTFLHEDRERARKFLAMAGQPMKEYKAPEPKK
jgi:hypothetical protein